MSLTRRQAARAMAAFGAGLSVALGGGAMAEDDDDALPNTFISPCGQPFRAKLDAPYAVVDWFKAADKDGDGKLDHAEFVADAAAFFKVLDLNGDGVLSHYEVSVYERRIAPEILGGQVKLGQAGRLGARLWLAQIDQPSPIDPSGDDHLDDAPPQPQGLDESGQGAAPYSLLDEPEPVLAADLDLNGLISKHNFLKLADMHFATLDQAGVGYLTLAKLPKTPVQRLLDKSRPRRKRS